MSGPIDAIAIDKEIRESDALRVYNRLMYLTDVNHIFERNYYEFLKLLTAFSTPEAILPFLGGEKKDDFHFLINELRRYFHNYVTSAETLTDHTRKMIKATYKNHEFINEYQARIDDEFTNNPLLVFVKDLRNYTVHYSLPATFSQIQLSQDPQTKQQNITSRALLDKEDLLYGYRWKPASKKYLVQSPKEINLMELINKHHDKFFSFYNWLLNRLKDIHANELKWLEQKSNEIRMIIDPISKKF